MKNIIYSSLIALALTFAITSYNTSLSSDLKNGLIRLHIVADSDSARDQEIKLVIRDRIIAGLGNGGLPEPDEAAQKAAAIANTVLKENNFSYTAAGEFCTAAFPKRVYKELTLPAGEYRTVRVTLGSGKGKNWWCVLYPPVCMADTQGVKMSEAARSQLRAALDEETYDVITRDVKVKFKIAELVGGLRNFLMEKTPASQQ